MRKISSCSTISIKEILQSFQKKEFFFDLVLLLTQVIKKPKEWILAHPEKILSFQQEKKLKRLIKRREKGEPIAYILNKKEFFSLPFTVNPTVLIPRPETELLVEKAITIINKTSTKRIILDLGTGSGCIIIALAKTLIRKKNLSFFGLDISSSALSVARKNAQKILKNQAQKIKFLLSDLLQIKNQPNFWSKNICDPKTEILILANLPYISQKEYACLEKTVKNFEPSLALLSGIKGLEHYEKFLKQFRKIKSHFPQNNFTLLLEFGWKQKQLLEKIISANLPASKNEFFKDLAGHWRVAKIEI